jgi:hypothetical protein
VNYSVHRALMDVLYFEFDEESFNSNFAGVLPKDSADAGQSPDDR